MWDIVENEFSYSMCGVENYWAGSCFGGVCSRE